jgi:hypothetical protein
MTDREQLEFIVRCDPTFLIRYIKEATNYDAKMLEVVFELAKEKARAALASSDAQADGGKGQSVAIYQVLDPIDGGWSDGPRSLYDATDGAFRRIVYTAPQAESEGEAAQFKETLHDRLNQYEIPTQLGVVAIMKVIEQVYQSFTAMQAECEPREALTDERISEIIEEFDGGSWIDGEYRIDCKDMMRLARAIEQAAKENQS